MNDSSNDAIFDDKWQTYQKFKDFFRRDVIFCNDLSQKEAFSAFIGEHSDFIVKPLSNSCGRGIKIIHSQSESTDELFKTLLKEYEGGFVAEELIDQVDEMKKFHPSSVNTVRVPTIRMDDEVLIVHPFMRMGQKGNCVDNGGAGGILCSVDPKTGVITAAADEKGKHYVEHPDTKEQIIGFQVPQWEELVQFANKLAMVVPENRYTGWDLALTDAGWVMIEGNRGGQFIFQIPTQVGFRKEINDIMHRLGLKY